MAKSNPYHRSTLHGKLLDNATIQAVQRAELKLGYELTIVQGIGGAAASAGTHTKGRAIDIAPWDIENKHKVLCDLGFIGWYRARIPGLWGAHGHYVLSLESRGNQQGIAMSAWRQIASFDRGRDGLKGDRPYNHYRPATKRNYHFETDPVRRIQITGVQKVRNKLVEANAADEQALAILIGQVDEGRKVARSFIDDLEENIEERTRMLKVMPPK